METTFILDGQDTWHAATDEGTPAGFAFVECDERVKSVEDRETLPFGTFPSREGDTVCDVCIAEIAVRA